MGGSGSRSPLPPSPCSIGAISTAAAAPLSGVGTASVGGVKTGPGWQAASLDEIPPDWQNPLEGVVLSTDEAYERAVAREDRKSVV